MRSTVPTSLAVCRGLFAALDDRDVRYCHWKSNEHLAEGLHGETDMDVLVDPEADCDVERLLEEHGFRRFETAWFVDYPGLEDYLAFDEETGRLVQLHLHRRLTLGQKRVKGYQLPWVDTVLSRRTYDEEHGVYRTDPETELLLLLVRYALKLQKRDYVAALTGEYLGDSERAEFDWLTARADPDAVAELAADLIGQRAGPVVADMTEPYPGLWAFRRLRKIVTNELSAYRIHGYLAAQVRGLARECMLGLRSLNERTVDRPRFARRTVPGGVVVAVLGVDGAGKSTVVADLDEWLSWKVDVQRIYYGSGDGPASLLRYPLIVARRRIDGGRAPSVAADGDGSGATRSENRSLVLRVGRVLRGLVLARERRKKLRRGWRARDRGFVVVGDRYPQNQVAGFTDGPLLEHLADADSRLARTLAARERAVYEAAEADPPDLVVKLDVSPETARERKPDMPLDQIEGRAQAVADLQFDAETVVIDAERPVAAVKRAVRGAVWKAVTLDSAGPGGAEDSRD